MTTFFLFRIALFRLILILIFSVSRLSSSWRFRRFKEIRIIDNIEAKCQLFLLNYPHYQGTLKIFTFWIFLRRVHVWLDVCDWKPYWNRISHGEELQKYILWSCRFSMLWGSVLVQGSLRPDAPDPKAGNETCRFSLFFLLWSSFLFRRTQRDVYLFFGKASRSVRSYSTYRI